MSSNSWGFGSTYVSGPVLMKTFSIIIIMYICIYYEANMAQKSVHKFTKSPSNYGLIIISRLTILGVLRGAEHELFLRFFQISNTSWDFVWLQTY